MTDPINLPDSPPLTFEQSLQRLEAIVQQLEDGRTDLAASLAGYEEGIKLLRQCHGLLERAERRIEMLSGVDAEGRPIAEPFDDTATHSLEEKQQTRSKRRSTKRPADVPPDRPIEPGGVDEPGSLF